MKHKNKEDNLHECAESSDQEQPQDKELEREQAKTTEENPE